MQYSLKSISRVVIEKSPLVMYVESRLPRRKTGCTLTTEAIGFIKTLWLDIISVWDCWAQLIASNLPDWAGVSGVMIHTLLRCISPF